MHIEHLSLKNFRNYIRLELSLTQGAVVIHGANAQGKTSLLEAIYYLATSSSPYTNSDRQLMNWNMDGEFMPFTQVGADIILSSHVMNHAEIILFKDQTPDGGERFRKEVKINGVSRRGSDLLGLLAVVMFLPQDMSLVEGPPAGRRRYLDIALCQTDNAYSQALSTFEKALTQRNALLRRIGDGFASPAELEYWDVQIAEAAGILIAGRQRFIRELERLAQRVHRDLSGRLEDLELVYQPSFEPTFEGDGQRSFNTLGLDLHRQLPPEDIVPQYRAALVTSRSDEIARGMTLIGPQRDEMRFLVNGRDLGTYGSRGQTRTGILALKLAELEWMHRTLNEWPVLLLDEVFAELDADRRSYLVDRIKDVNQVLLTTTEISTLAPEFLHKAALWQVRDGQITIVEARGA